MQLILAWTGTKCVVKDYHSPFTPAVVKRIGKDLINASFHLMWPVWPVLCVSCCNNFWIQMGVFNLPTPAPSLTFLQCKQILVVVVVSIGQRHYGHFNSNYNIRQITATTTNTWHELIQHCQWKVIDGMFWVGGNKYSHFTRMKCYTRKLCK